MPRMARCGKQEPEPDRGFERKALAGSFSGRLSLLPRGAPRTSPPMAAQERPGEQARG